MPQTPARFIAVGSRRKNTKMNEFESRYALNELIKNYHIFSSFDDKRGRELLTAINEIRLAAAARAEQRQIFWKQLSVPSNNAGYTNDLFLTSDDIRSIFARFVAYLGQDVTLGLLQEGSREIVFTRERVAWQQIASSVQSSGNGQAYPFELPQEIFLDKNQTLNFSITGQQQQGYIFAHGANLKDDLAPNLSELAAEIGKLDEFGKPSLPQTVLVPIQFQFLSNQSGAVAVAVNGASDIFTNKDSRSVLLTEISTTSINSRLTIIDNGRNQLLCDTVESQGIAGNYLNPYSVFYPLPYPHLLRAQDRLQLKAINGSVITTEVEDADTVFTVCFRGYTI